MWRVEKYGDNQLRMAIEPSEFVYVWLDVVWASLISETGTTGGSQRGKSVASRFQSLASARPHEASAMQAPASGQVMDTLFRAASRNQVRVLAASGMQVQLARLPQVQGKCIS